MKRCKQYFTYTNTCLTSTPTLTNTLNLGNYKPRRHYALLGMTQPLMQAESSTHGNVHTCLLTEKERQEKRNFIITWVPTPRIKAQI